MLDAVIAEREAGSSHVIGVSENQTLRAGGSLSAWAEGYQTGDNADEVAAKTTSALPGGSLNLVSQGAGSTIAVYGGQLKLMVMAVQEGEAATWLEGDVAHADITLAGWGADTGSSNNMLVGAAGIVISTSAHALDALSSVTIGGTGFATIYNNDGSALSRIDASAMDSVHPPDADVLDAASGLTYLSFNSKSETITLGAGVDELMLWDSTVGSTDVVVGLNLVALEDHPGVLDRQASDRLVLGMLEEAGTGYEIFNVADAGTYPLERVLESLAAEGKPAVFHWCGDTFVFSGGDNRQIDDSDVLVRLVGELDLGLLASSLGVVDDF